MEPWAEGSGRYVPGTGFPVVTTVRDALYDRIPLAAEETALIGTRAFQRLERIQQLGFVSRIWPGAKHARFEHSLGVLHLSRLALAHLRTTPGGTWITDEDARTHTAAALLHDIGHYPFSHAIEELGPPILSHEQVGRRIIEGPEIASILRAVWSVDPQRVAAIVAPDGYDLLPGDQILRGLLSGPLDVDKLDYLPRDARACNVPYGGVDTSRLIDSLTIEGGEAASRQGGKADKEDAGTRCEPLTETSRSPLPLRRLAASPPRIVVSAKGVSPLHSLINARQEMFDNVYWHHTNRACMAMLLRAVQEAVMTGAVTPEELTDHDDASLLALMEADRMPDSTRRLTVALRERRVHKRAVEVSARAFELYSRLGNLFYDPDARRVGEMQMTSALAELIGEPIPSEAILIDIPKPEKWRTDVWVRFNEPPVGFSSLMPWRDVVGLGDDDFKRYEEHRRLIRIVTSAPYRDVVAANWEHLIIPLLGGVV